MSRLHAAGLALALAGAAAPQAQAALITFDFVGSTQIGTTLNFVDRSGHYTIKASGVFYNTGMLDSSFQVTRDNQGLGIRASGDTSDFIELNGPNDRLRLDLGSNAFSLRGLNVALPQAGTTELMLVYLDGQGDTTVDVQQNVGGSGSVNLNSGPLSVLDFAGGGNGYKLVSMNFETGVPLPAASRAVAAPQSASLAMLALGMVAGLRRRPRPRG